jgi:flagellin
MPPSSSVAGTDNTGSGARAVIDNTADDDLDPVVIDNIDVALDTDQQPSAPRWVPAVRFEAVIANLQISVENQSAARSMSRRIMDCRLRGGDGRT